MDQKTRTARREARWPGVYELLSQGGGNGVLMARLQTESRLTCAERFQPKLMFGEFLQGHKRRHTPLSQDPRARTRIRAHTRIRASTRIAPAPDPRQHHGRHGATYPRHRAFLSSRYATALTARGRRGY